MGQTLSILLLVVLLAIVVLHFIDMRVSILAGGAIVLLIPGWLPVAGLYFLNAAVLWYTHRITGRYPPYMSRLMIVMIILSGSLLFIQIQDLTVPKPMWDIDAKGKVTVDCNIKALPVSNGAVQDIERPNGITAAKLDAVRGVSDRLVSRLVTRTDTTNDNYLFLSLGLVRATFPDGVTRDAWYRVIISDPTHPDYSLYAVYVELDTNKPLMLIRNVGINRDESVWDVYNQCGTIYGILPSQGLFINEAGSTAGFMLIPLVVSIGFLFYSMWMGNVKS